MAGPGSPGPPGSGTKKGDPGSPKQPVTKTGTSEGFKDQRYDMVEFLKHALASAGSPSKWGGTSPAGFDCSGLVQYALRWEGIAAPRTSEEQAAWVKPVGGNQLQPGDLIFEKGTGSAPPGHVVIYMGQGLVLAADEGGPVHMRAFNPASEGVMSYGRPPGAVWDQSTSTAGTYLKEIDKYATAIGTSGKSIAIPPEGLTFTKAKLPPPQVVIDKWGNPVSSRPTVAGQVSAYGTVHAELDRWGLGELAPMAFKRAMAGEDAAQITTDIRKTTQYAAVFPGMDLRAKEGLPPLSEDAYMTYQNYMMGLANKFALPHGFITKTEVGKLVAQNVSPAEFNQRLTALSGVATKADPLVRQEFAKFYGPRQSLGALTAYFADPKRATDLLSQQAQAAQLAAQAGESGLGALNKAQATHLAQLEYTQHLAPGTVRQAIDTASSLSYLHAHAPGAVAPTVNANQLIGAQVPGYTHEGAAADRSAVRGAESARESFLNSGGGFAANPTGVTGAGGASTEGRGRA